MGYRLKGVPDKMLCKPIRQKHRTGCGIACVAMLTGNTYDAVMKKARQVFFWSETKRSYYTSSAQLRELLDLFQVETSKGHSVRNRTTLPSRAVLGINHNESSNTWHWVVYCRGPDGEYVLDPQSVNIYRTDFGRMRLYSCISIIE